MWTVKFKMFKLDLEKAEGPEIKLPTSAGSSKKQESSRKTSAATAKSLQSCPTLCDPIDGSPPGSTVLGILQAKLQQYVNRELPDVQAGFRKGRGTRDQIANICWIIEKAREVQKKIYFCFIDYAKAFDCVDHNKLWKILNEMGIPDHLTCLMRNLYAGQEAAVRTAMEQQTGFK